MLKPFIEEKNQVADILLNFQKNTGEKAENDMCPIPNDKKEYSPKEFYDIAMKIPHSHTRKPPNRADFIRYCVENLHVPISRR